MLNHTVLMGRLTADPDLRHTSSNIPVVTFTVAVNRSYVKPGAERETDFFEVVAWRNTAEFVCKYFRRGQMIAVDGKIQTRSYVDKDNNKRKAFEILADNVYFTESKNPGSNYERPSDSPLSESVFSSGESDDFSVISDDDDLPF